METSVSSSRSSDRWAPMAITGKAPGRRRRVSWALPTMTSNSVTFSRSSAGRISRSALRIGSWGSEGASPSVIWWSLGAEEECGVVAAEAEAVAHGALDATASRAVGGVVEVALGVRALVVDGGWDD